MLPAVLDRKQIGPAGPASVLLVVLGLGLMLLAMLLANRFALIMVVLSAGVLFGNALVLGIMWLWQLGKI